MSAHVPSTLRALIDTDALAANAETIRERIGGRRLMSVVKADAYGHGIAHTVPALLRAGVRDLGVATLSEALALRAFLDDLPAVPGGVRILFWLHDVDTDLAPALRAGIEVGVSTSEALARARSAAQRTGAQARVHLKVDTGLGRGGLSPAQFADLLDTLKNEASPGPPPPGAVAPGPVQVVGLMTHLANADLPGDPTTGEQIARFASMRADLTKLLDSTGGALGRADELESHLANSPGALGGDDTGGTMVRVGLSTYGLTPFDEISAEDLGLRPAMTLVSRVITVKDVPAGHGASYGLTYRAPRATRFALVAGGYADGIPRAASGGAQVTIRGRRLPVVGRIAMDQMVVDAGTAPVETGDEVVVLGDGATGPTAEEWGEWSGSINYEIVTRVGQRVDRLAIGGTKGAGRQA